MLGCGLHYKNNWCSSTFCCGSFLFFF
uniref:Uncharacterized protein n=1 Tax=Rhizophora mucronata TaxID=61149 RepID=A0A2P2IS93_RHIMU